MPWGLPVLLQSLDPLYGVKGPQQGHHCGYDPMWEVRVEKLKLGCLPKGQILLSSQAGLPQQDLLGAYHHLLHLQAGQAGAWYSERACSGPA